MPAVTLYRGRCLLAAGSAAGSRSHPQGQAATGCSGSTGPNRCAQTCCHCNLSHVLPILHQGHSSPRARSCFHSTHKLKLCHGCSCAVPGSLKHCNGCAGAGDVGGAGPQYDVYGRPVTDPLQEAAADAAENARPLLLGRNKPKRSQAERDAANTQARAEQRAWWDSELEKARRETRGGPRPVRVLHPPLARYVLC